MRKFEEAEALATDAEAVRKEISEQGFRSHKGYKLACLVADLADLVKGIYPAVSMKDVDDHVKRPHEEFRKRLNKLETRVGEIGAQVFPAGEPKLNDLANQKCLDCGRVYTPWVGDRCECGGSLYLVDRKANPAGPPPKVKKLCYRDGKYFCPVWQGDYVVLGKQWITEASQIVALEQWIETPLGIVALFVPVTEEEK